jgi:hypothetical protein
MLLLNATKLRHFYTFALSITTPMGYAYGSAENKTILQSVSKIKMVHKYVTYFI